MIRPLTVAIMLALGFGITPAAIAGNGTAINPDSANTLTLAV